MSEEENEEKNIEDLYVSEENQKVEINGIEIEYKELSGIEYTEIVDDLDMEPDDPTSMSNKDFILNMLRKCVVKPENLKIEKLKADVLTKLSSEVQGGLNMEGAMENLGKK